MWGEFYLTPAATLREVRVEERYSQVLIWALYVPVSLAPSQVGLWWSRGSPRIRHICHGDLEAVGSTSQPSPFLLGTHTHLTSQQEWQMVAGWGGRMSLACGMYMMLRAEAAQVCPLVWQWPPPHPGRRGQETFCHPGRYIDEHFLKGFPTCSLKRLPHDGAGALGGLGVQETLRSGVNLCWGKGSRALRGGSGLR